MGAFARLREKVTALPLFSGRRVQLFLACARSVLKLDRKSGTWP